LLQFIKGGMTISTESMNDPSHNQEEIYLFEGDMRRNDKAEDEMELLEKIIKHVNQDENNIIGFIRMLFTGVIEKQEQICLNSDDSTNNIRKNLKKMYNRMFIALVKSTLSLAVKKKSLSIPIVHVRKLLHVKKRLELKKPELNIETEPNLVEQKQRDIDNDVNMPNIPNPLPQEPMFIDVPETHILPGGRERVVHRWVQVAGNVVTVRPNNEERSYQDEPTISLTIMELLDIMCLVDYESYIEYKNGKNIANKDVFDELHQEIIDEFNSGISLNLLITILQTYYQNPIFYKFYRKIIVNAIESGINMYMDQVQVTNPLGSTYNTVINNNSAFSYELLKDYKTKADYIGEKDRDQLLRFICLNPSIRTNIFDPAFGNVLRLRGELKKYGSIPLYCSGTSFNYNIKMSEKELDMIFEIAKSYQKDKEQTNTLMEYELKNFKFQDSFTDLDTNALLESTCKRKRKSIYL